jgi:hypothetical protein
MTCLPVSETLKMNIVNPLQEETMGLLKAFPLPETYERRIGNWEIQGYVAYGMVSVMILPQLGLETSLSKVPYWKCFILGATSGNIIY